MGESGEIGRSYGFNPRSMRSCLSGVKNVLHYLGYDSDPGGIVSVVRNLAEAGRFNVCLGLNHGGRQHRTPALPQVEFTALDGEVLTPQTFWRSRRVAREIQAWLAEDSDRIFHGHSRAGLVVGNWLHQWGERRIMVSVHCYGRRRWFYREAAERLGRRLYWLSPAMKRHYEIAAPDTWEQCMPGGVILNRPALMPDEAQPRSTGFCLVGIGDVVTRKRWDLVLTALREMPPAVTFAHIGGGAETVVAELARQTAELGLSDRVTWHGRQPDSQWILAKADALVVASENEPFAMAILEALAAGVPVVAADSGGTVDVVESGKNGELFKSGDAIDLAAAVKRWRERGIDSRLPTPDNSWRFAAGNIARHWADIYESLAD